MTKPLPASNGRLVAKLILLTAAMFGFGYALVPLYNVFCEVTGLNGKTGRLSNEQASAFERDETREVTVEFVTNVNAGLPWDFAPKVTKVKVHPGVVTAVDFGVVNRSDQNMVGQAVPSVAPQQAARFFSKTECFCFVQQPLAAKEQKNMPVRFVIDPKLPKDIDTVTLSYTFFESPPQTAERKNENEGDTTGG